MTILFVLETIDARRYKKLYKEYKKAYEDLAEAHRKLKNEKEEEKTKVDSKVKGRSADIL
jgi:hypothetical protein